MTLKGMRKKRLKKNPAEDKYGTVTVNIEKDRGTYFILSIPQ